jgi:hypothetical protein
MKTCPKCKAKISYLVCKEWGNGEIEWNYRKVKKRNYCDYAVHPNINKFDVSEREFICPTCGDKLFGMEEDAEKFLVKRQKSDKELKALEKNGWE